jgi:Na+/H+-dicarboxylate symporter
MPRRWVHLYRVDEPRKSRVRMGWRPVLFFVALSALAALVGIMREDALRKAAIAQSFSSQERRR